MSKWIQNWWVLLFLLSISAIHFHFVKLQNRSLTSLELRVEQMDQNRLAALDQQSYLKEQIASQNDPAWIEQVLMRDLGVVPEGFMKVHFQ